jgi:predicted AAA+ superfamily ATPase
MSKEIQRAQTPAIVEDLGTKMVFLVGPRQCGKTTLASQILADEGGAYFSWDVDAHRRALREGALPEDKRLWVFDELHKQRTWRNWLKGQFDLHRTRHRILVTGSARLDVYHRGGDSLQGRYFLHHLHPFTLAEAAGIARPLSSLDQLPARMVDPGPAAGAAVLRDLLRLGGFPEPFLSGSDRQAARWRRSYGATLVREDIRDLEALHDLDKIQLLYERLPACVGSTLSINALREDLEVAFETVRNWLLILDRTYATFRVAPLGAPRIRAVKKAQKLYLWDWARVESEGARFENLLAVHLLRLCDYAGDVLGESLELRYFRDVLGHEVDFVLLRRGKPWIAIEAKSGGGLAVGAGFNYLLERMRFPLALRVGLGTTGHVVSPSINGTPVHCMPAHQFLAALV